jgi:phenylpropionate dioxygenase-like ring-hydroxylating dioxygenase large terminal subunit
MQAQVARREDILGLVDVEKGVVDRRIYSAEDIYQLELERIFARAWNFVAHDSQIPNPGDFFMNFIGEDRVIVVRDNDGAAQVLVNSCRHRGNAVCRAEEGHSSSFMCTYHGWTYDLKGNLVGVPGFKEVYHEELDRENWGLIKAQVQTYQGFIFACLDEDPPDLDEFLGEVGRMCIDLLVARGPLKIAGGIEKWTIGCNWKFAADNVWDYYHAGITHFSASVLGWQRQPAGESRPPRFGAPHIAILGKYGHALGGPETTDATIAAKAPYDSAWRAKEESRDLVGPLGMRAGGNIHVFPNVWVQQGFWQVSLRLPKGPTKTEIWWFVFTSEEMDAETQKTVIKRSARHNGPAGMFEIDDGENWGESTRGTVGVISRKYPLNYAMNVGRGEVIGDETTPAHIEALNNEHAQLWYYQSWSEWMAAESWDDLNASHSLPAGIR